MRAEERNAAEEAANITDQRINALQIAPSGGGTWGSIGGTLSAQADLQTALNLKAGVPTGTPTGAKFLRDDNAWAAPPSGGSSLDDILALQALL